jgi:hypothetical protein
LRSFLTQRQIGHTPFLWACWQANDEFIAQLADVGNADINTQDQVASWPPCPLPLTFITGWQYGTSFGLPSRGCHARGSFIESKCSMESQKLCKRASPPHSLFTLTSPPPKDGKSPIVLAEEAQRDKCKFLLQDHMKREQRETLEREERERFAKEQNNRLLKAERERRDRENNQREDQNRNQPLPHVTPAMLADSTTLTISSLKRTFERVVSNLRPNV